MTMRYVGMAALTARAISALDAAVNESANDLVAKAVQAAPIDEGTLRASIQTDGAQRKGMTVEAKVYTGAESSDYAAVMHEDVYTPRSGGGRKYLERPLLENKPLYVEAMRRAARVRF